MTELRESTCPGCGLRMPVSDTAAYEGYYNTSPECWDVYTEVLGSDFSNAVLFGQVHQLTVTPTRCSTLEEYTKTSRSPSTSVDCILC